ncbi:ribosome assembly RNA-binding protein YhbY [Nitrosomonas sp.]|uniref:ribosome assembly RNA-binding protein YhbY n=1 Tax=Nitrosomonas sp. TaxID=42353 RepID=UPI001DD4B16B|nr:ribosome assembly RNA-binding protein YhbY [Nitrosomonas sp.]MBX3616629.1 ribosome assembly RNA-binding protein YhbY [Nitrosomonas sp.]
MLTITVTQRRELKAQAHALNPIVMIGKSGLSANVVGEIERALSSHALIKIKAQVDDRAARDVVLEEICQLTNAAPVQHVGKVFVIYRPKPEEIEKKLERVPSKKKRPPLRRKRDFQNE